MGVGETDGINRFVRVQDPIKLKFCTGID